MTTFADLIATATETWNDSGGFWATYNAKLAGMFETIYGITSDQGDPDQTIIGSLSSTLSTATPINLLPVSAVSEFVAVGTEVTISFAQFSQSFTTSGDAHVGDGGINVVPDTPNYPYPTGSTVQLLYEPGWSNLLDPTTCPDEFLVFLGQFNGTEIPISLDPDTARAKITGESAQHRGTTDSIRSAILRNIGGTQTISILERTDNSGNPDAYRFVVTLRSGDVGVSPQTIVNAANATPGGPVQTIIDAVNLVKPGGVMWTLVITNGFTWSQALHTWNADTFAWNSGQQP